jgi:hypothetical protein
MESRQREANRRLKHLIEDERVQLQETKLKFDLQKRQRTDLEDILRFYVEDVKVEIEKR